MKFKVILFLNIGHAKEGSDINWDIGSIGFDYLSY